jgi:hypothetical protein
MGQFLTLAKFSAFAAVALLSPVFAFLIAIAVEILFGAVADAGALPPVAFIAIGAVGCSRLRKLYVCSRGREPIQT